MPLAVIHSPVAALAVFALAGLIWGPYPAVETTAVQRVVPRDELGALFGLQRALLVGAFPAGAAVGGLLLDHFAVTTVIAATTLACTTAGLAALASRSIRRISPETGR